MLPLIETCINTPPTHCSSTCLENQIGTLEMKRTKNKHITARIGDFAIGLKLAIDFVPTLDVLIDDYLWVVLYF